MAAPGAIERDAVVVGAGFAGLYALHRLREAGYSTQVIERGSDVGGTWFWNRYPGARCDIESVDYCYYFSRELLEEWKWSERYAAQPEILRYINHVADRFDLRKDIRFGAEVVSAEYAGEDERWLVTTADGTTYSARVVILAVGCLSAVKRPEIAGSDAFEGRLLHTATWPREGVDLAGRRVGVIGTGSTGIQLVTRLAPVVDRLVVFQRTPNYSVPAQNRPLGEKERREVLDEQRERRELARSSNAGVPRLPPERDTFAVDESERERMFEAGWKRGGIDALSYAFTDYFTDARANAVAQEFARKKIREAVKDPKVAASLTPDYDIGTKRTCVDTGYFDSYNRDNVELVDLRQTPLREITKRGVLTSATEYELDTLVMATGFDAMTGAILGIDIRGREGLSLREEWKGGPKTYLGLAVHGFPNMFLVTGPGSPSVLSNMVLSIEQHVEWITEALVAMDVKSGTSLEATVGAQEDWTEYVTELASETLYPRATSWYLGANIPGKPRVFMPFVGGCGAYREICDGVAADDYRGFEVRHRVTQAGRTERDATR